MPIQVLCPRCSKALAYAEQYAGRPVRCPHCKGVLNTPPAKEQSPSPPGSGAGSDTRPNSNGVPATPPPKPSSRSTADRNLLFGILALQMDFISRDALITAMQAWVFRKDRTLGQILVEQDALAEDSRAALDVLVHKHLQRHGNDAERSLAAITPASPICAELQRIADPELQAGLSHIAANSITDPEATDSFGLSRGLPSELGQRFRIVRPHARGGLGEVFVAIDEELHREVALKEIQVRHADSDENRARFLREAEITGRLEHPGIVPVYGLGQDADGRPFYAMRFIRGVSFKEAIDRYHRTAATRRSGERNLELRQLLDHFVAVCNAIAYAHSRGVLHRDLKPANVMLGNYGETLVVDWGLAKLLDRPERESGSQESILQPTSAGDSQLTQMGRTLGTPAYMSPEQAAGRLDRLGPASDVYSLGATLYYLLTGRAAFDEGDLGAILVQVQQGAFAPPRQHNPRVPPALESICLKAMAVRPEDRYPSARALGGEIERWLADEPVAAYREPWPARLGRWVRRHKGMVTIGSAVAAVVLIAVIAGALLVAAAERADRQQKIAEDMSRLRGEAEEQRIRAEEQEALARRYLYFSRMNMAGIAWQDAQVARMQELLEDELPQQNGGEDLRGFEWYYLWRLRHSQQFTIAAHPRTAFAVAWSPDGKRLATASGNYLRLDKPGEVKVWDAATGKELLVLRGYPCLVREVAFSPDGKRLAACGLKGPTVQVRNAATGEMEREIDLGANASWSLSFSPDSRRLALTAINRVEVCDLASGATVFTLLSDAPSFSDVRYSPDRKYLATASASGIQLWDAADGKEVRSFKAKGALGGLTFSPDGKRLAGAAADLSIHVHDVADGRELFVLQGHTAVINGLAFSPDGQKLVSASHDRTLKVWDMRSGRELFTLRGHTSAVTAAAFSPDGDRLASVGSDGMLRIWQPIAPQEALVIKGGSQGLAFSPDGTRLASGATVKVWDPLTGKEALALKGDTTGARGVAFSPNGAWLAAACGVWENKTAPPVGGEVRLWRMSDGTFARTFPGFTLHATAVAFTPDGKSLAAVSGDYVHRDKPGEVKMWETDSGREQLSFPVPSGGLLSMAFSPDGKRLAAAGFDRIIHLWDTATGKEELSLTGHTKTIYAIAFSPDGRYLASSSSDLTIKIWDLSSGKVVHSLRGHALFILGLSFSPDGQRLASASQDATVKLWDVSSGQETLTLRGHTASVGSVVFSPDGRRLASGSGDGTIRIWDGTPSQAITVSPASAPNR